MLWIHEFRHTPNLALLIYAGQNAIALGQDYTCPVQHEYPGGPTGEGVAGSAQTACAHGPNLRAPISKEVAIWKLIIKNAIGAPNHA